MSEIEANFLSSDSKILRFSGSALIHRVSTLDQINLSIARTLALEYVLNRVKDMLEALEITTFRHAEIPLAGEVGKRVQAECMGREMLDSQRIPLLFATAALINPRVQMLNYITTHRDELKVHFATHTEYSRLIKALDTVVMGLNLPPETDFVLE
jgi:hypothetical protein